MSKRPLYSYVVPPQFRLQSPGALLSEQDYDLLRITVEDFRFVTRDITEDLTEVAAEIRSRSTILRRLLCESDLFNAGRLLPPKNELRVQARMLDFEPLHPAIIISCGEYPWAGDILPGMAMEVKVKGIDPTGDEPPWDYRENADVSLREYLDGLAIGVLGTRIRRRQVVKYVADKKAAHVTDRRKHPYEQALDRAWSHLSLQIVADDEGRVKLNVVYLEILALIRALQESQSVNDYVDDLASWVATAELETPEGARPSGLSLRVEPSNRSEA